jgi:hypothetical protein
MNSYISMPGGEETPEKPDSGFIPLRQAGTRCLRRRLSADLACSACPKRAGEALVAASPRHAIMECHHAPVCLS